MVPGAGFEPALPCGKRILSLRKGFLVIDWMSALSNPNVRSMLFVSRDIRRYYLS